LALCAAAVFGFRQLNATHWDHPFRVEISTETTYFTDNVTESGFPDFAKSLNELQSEGVTAEINAFPLLLRSLGDRYGYPSDSTGYADLLWDELGTDAMLGANPGIGAIKESPDWFTLSRTLEGTQETPWKKSDYPQVASLLAAHESALQLVKHASRRTKFYRPLIPIRKEDSGRTTSYFPLSILRHDLQHFGTISSLFCSRAMLQLKQGNIEQSADDILTVHRVARLLRDDCSASLFDHILMDRTAWQAATEWGIDPRITAAEARAFRTDLESLGPLETIASVEKRNNLFNRIAAIDAIFSVATQIKRPESLIPGTARRQIPPSIEACFERGVDWNDVLQIVNAQYDKLAVVFSNSNDQSRLTQARALAKEWNETADRVVTTTTSVDARELGKWLTPHLVSDPRILEDNLRSSRARHQLSRTLLALAEYRAIHHRYPTRLPGLVPNILDEDPIDPFGDHPLSYVVSDDGLSMTVYSIGINRTDDNGFGRGESPQNAMRRTDDIRIRVGTID